MRAFSVKASLLALFVSGCASLSAVSPAVDNQAVIVSVQSCEGSPDLLVSPITYMNIGFTKIDVACRAYFDRLTEITQETRIARKGLGSGNLAALAVLNATNAATKAITITGAGVTLVDQLVQEFAETYAYTPYLYKIRQLVQDSMQDFKTRSLNSAKTAGLATRSADNYCAAYTYIVDYASLCTKTAVQTLFDQQIAVPSVADNKQGAGGTPGGVPKPGLAGLSQGTFAERPSPNYTVRALPVQRP
jgi:hypothetical protein